MKQNLLFIIKKLIRVLLLTAGVSIAAFALLNASPVDPLQANVGQAALGSMSREQIQKLEEYWGVGAPPLSRFLSWAGDFLRGDMGISLLYRQRVADILAERLSNSLLLMAAAWLISGTLGFLLGVISGLHEGKAADKIIKGYVLLTASTPGFWLALLLLLIFGVWLKVLPVGLSVPAGVTASGVTFADRIRHAVLPAAALSITGVANIALHTREKMIEVMESEYILFAKARGESRRRIVISHALRNIALPALTLQFASVSEIFGGSILAEQVFSYPGLGQAAVTAGLGGDVPLLMAITVISSLLVFGGNLAADLLYGLIDPRMRKGGSRT